MPKDVALGCDVSQIRIEEALYAIHDKDVRSATIERLKITWEADELVKDLPQQLQLGEGLYECNSNFRQLRAAPWTSYLSKEITITEEWKEFWGTFVMPVDDNIAGVYIESRDTVGLTWFDHFRLYEGDYFEEDIGQKEKAVTPYGNLISTWAKVKSNMEK